MSDTYDTQDIPTVENTAESITKRYLRFIHDPSKEKRIVLANDVCVQFNDPLINDKERALLHDILQHLVKDIEESIRLQLVHALQYHPRAPHDITLTLAQDTSDAVAAPMLEYSQTLTDQDLVHLIQSAKHLSHHRKTERCRAMANRTQISERVSDELVSTNVKEVVQTLIHNQGAQISDESTEQIIHQFAEEEDVLGALMTHGRINVGLAERMVDMVSTKIYTRLQRQYHQHDPLLKKQLSEAAEEVTISRIAYKSDEDKKLNLVDHLYHNGKLTHSILMRSLCRAEISFFEQGLARLAGISTANVHKLIYEGGSKAFHALYRAASLPQGMEEATHTLVQLMLEYPPSQNKDKASFYQNILDTIKQREYDQNIPNMGYFLALMQSQSNKATLH